MGRIQYSRMGVKSYSVVGWTYEADVWCNECADEMGISNDKDSDEMGPDDGFPIFADSEWDYQPYCAGCGAKTPYVTVLEYDD